MFSPSHWIFLAGMMFSCFESEFQRLQRGGADFTVCDEIVSALEVAHRVRGLRSVDAIGLAGMEAGGQQGSLDFLYLQSAHERIRDTQYLLGRRCEVHRSVGLEVAHAGHEHANVPSTAT